MNADQLSVLQALPAKAPSEMPAHADYRDIGTERAEIWALAHARQRLDRLWATEEQFHGDSGPSGPRLPMGGWACIDVPGTVHHTVEPTAAAIRRSVYDAACNGLPCGPRLVRHSRVGRETDTVIGHAFSPRLLFWASIGLCSPYADTRPLAVAPADMVAEFSGLHREIMGVSTWRGAGPVISSYRLRADGSIDLLTGPPVVAPWVLDRIVRAMALARDAVPYGTTLASLRAMIVDDVTGGRI